MGDIFGIIFVRPLGLILMAIFSLVKNYGVALILFTVLIKLVLLPFMYKQKKSMKKMNLVSVESQKLQKRYAKNKEKLNEEMQKLYEREGVNPMGSCLMSFITLPIMMALYYAVREPLTYMMGLADTTIQKLGSMLHIAMDGSNISAQIQLAKAVNDNWDQVAHFAPEGLVPIDFNFFGLDLSAIPQIGEFNALWMIPILSGLTAFLSSKVMQSMQKKTSPQNAATQMNSTMNTMLIMMPLMSVWIAFTLPASMGIYWIINNVFTMLQEVALTWYILKFDKAEDDEETKERKRRAAEHQHKLEEHEHAVQSGITETYLGANSANVSKKKLKAREAEQKRLKEKETAARAAEIKAEKEAARRAGRQVDDDK